VSQTQKKAPQKKNMLAIKLHVLIAGVAKLKFAQLFFFCGAKRKAQRIWKTLNVGRMGRLCAMRKGQRRIVTNIRVLFTATRRQSSP
jgi:hypothetical protein